MPNFTPLGVLCVLNGLGLLTAPGCEQVRVRYRLVFEAQPAGIIAHGTLRGKGEALHPIWLEPDSRLRLEDGRWLDVSVTELMADEATIESTGRVPDLTGTSKPKVNRRRRQP